MSDIMWYDPAHKMPWKEIAVHDHDNVRGFFGNYRFLSNFWPAHTWYEDRMYPSVEHAYQAAKCHPMFRPAFQDANTSSAEAKQLPKQRGWMMYTPDEWNEIRYDVMATAVFHKFCDDRELRQKLLDTGDRHLEETNWWRDTYWGWDVRMKTGANNLGTILMKTRAFWR